ncbi:competence/damage-inducible protein A [Halalkalibacter akibai]|uniref:Putative competence-damage inducible protein n=1 Tax=Halalkalibacter akibai (strain ATCC 43226 / DSM 21942 / CIP 109018 / JCM 9157 / 1139) TaxID=1236973 RepID=W4QSQ9_HALA3|nr:competence/damage-inducible protein A [Halalkalibacter akibai]GAE34673.1 N-terminal domain of CinA protein [Halalkalibacter akibai JCM 9157]
MNAEIISVGSELLLGQIVNTNATFISQKLAIIGVNVFYQTTVGDNSKRLTEALRQARSRSDLVILTGGLGPTKDDLTKESVADLIGKPLVYHQESLHYIENYFKKRNKPMSENNRKQALVIEDSQVLANHFGMAPGMIASFEDCQFILLPGPPKEMKPMFLNELLPYLINQIGGIESITSRVLRFFGIGESQLETDLLDLIESQTNPTIAPLANEGEVTLRLTVKHSNIEEQNRLLDETEALIMDRVGEYMYGYDDTSLMEQLFLQLNEKRCTIATAESLTGGKFSGLLTSFSGASSVFRGGVVSYATDVKESVLGVSKDVIDRHGVISSECAIEMAASAKEKLNSDIAISFTGVAGPGTQENKEPGTVFIGIAGLSAEPMYCQLNLAGGREAVRDRAIKYGCFYLLNQLKRWNKAE